jgi:replicative DNA helicase
MDFRYKRDSIKDINGYIAELISQLEPLQLNTSSKDPAVMGEVDLGSDESLREVFSAIKQNNEGARIYKTGWTDLNDMLQGGIRPGEFIITPALQHKYKTGFNLSLFAQIARLNQPNNIDPGKKPLLLRISFEDELVNNLQFLYQYLKYNETREYVGMKDLSVEEMASYVKKELQQTGFHVKMMRVDPTQWSYRNICSKVIELEAQGYSIEGLFLDYLAMIPTTGCITSGPIGTDMRDLIRRVRNFCAT